MATLIDTYFTITTEFGDYTVFLTKHLFIRRTIKGVTEPFVRSHIFQTREQFEIMLRHLFSYDELNTFYGHVVVRFKYKEESYSLLLSLEKNDTLKNPTVTIITVEKISDRHYYKHVSFVKERKKIYTDFILPESRYHKSHISLESNISNSSNSHYRALVSKYFNKIMSNNNSLMNLDLYTIIRSLVSRYNYDNSCKTYWIPVKGENQLHFFRVGFEKLLEGNKERLALIFIDYKSNIEAAKKRAAETKEEFLYLGLEKRSFQALVRQNNVIGGLRIVKKNITDIRL